MGLRFLYRNFSCNVKRLTSNIEVFTEMPTTKHNTLSEKDSVNLLKNSRKYVDEINKLLDSKPFLNHLKDKVPATYFVQKTTSKKFYMFVIDKDVACDMFKAMQPDLQNYSGHIMEINAGTGVLTELLIKARLRNLRIYEPDATLCNYLLEMIKHYESDGRLFMVNILKLGSMMKQDSHDNGGRVEAVFDGFLPKNWEDEPVAKVIAAVPNEEFIHHAIFSLVLQCGFFQYGRTEMFFVIPQQHYDKLKSNPNEKKLYRAKSVLFQVFFDYEVLLNIPAEAFIPLCSTTKRRNQSKDINDELVFLKITPRKDLLQRIPQNLLKPFWFFVKIFMHKKSSLLIESMEKLVPGSGIHLITKGYTIFTNCGSLTPDEYVTLFLEFSSWPEFSSCSFLSSMENLMSRVLKLGTLEEALSEKFNYLINNESDVVDDNVELFDDNENLEKSNKNVTVEESST